MASICNLQDSTTPFPSSSERPAHHTYASMGHFGLRAIRHDGLVITQYWLSWLQYVTESSRADTDDAVWIKFQWSDNCQSGHVVSAGKMLKMIGKISGSLTGRW